VINGIIEEKDIHVTNGDGMSQTVGNMYRVFKEETKEGRCRETRKGTENVCWSVKIIIKIQHGFRACYLG
jgi:hypothetical protein